MMSKFRAEPKLGHLDGVKPIVAYISNMRHAIIHLAPRLIRNSLDRI